ncbi:MAG: hypothetical protein VKK59_03740 [Vampirovibrionales bacterium]|nr:hypothetical protein [Vampirovibrionales bacterium]
MGILIILPSDTGTQKAHAFLDARGLRHQVIKIPERLGYKTGAHHGIYANDDYSMLLTQARLVVMRVFRGFEPLPEELAESL